MKYKTRVWHPFHKDDYYWAWHKTYRHDFQTCRCGKVSVDGGHDYLRRCADSPDDYTDLSETAEIDESEKEEEY